MIGHLGCVQRFVDHPTYTCATPYGLEVCTYNESGNIIEKTIDDETTFYQYDEQNRLLQEANTFEDRLTSHNETPCVYNDLGNLAQKREVQYIYVKNNKLIEVTAPGYIVCFTY